MASSSTHPPPRIGHRGDDGNGHRARGRVRNYQHVHPSGPDAVTGDCRWDRSVCDHHSRTRTVRAVTGSSWPPAQVSPTGAAFVDTGDGCVEDNSSGVYTFSHAQVTTTSGNDTRGHQFVHDHGAHVGVTPPARLQTGSATGTGSLVVAQAPTATTSAATSVTGTTATLNGTVNAENASTTVTFCYSTSTTIGSCTGTVTTVNGSTPTVTGTTNTAETAALTGLTPNTDVLLQHQGGQQRRHHLWHHADQFHDRAGPDRHHERGQRHHGHHLDPQRLGQRRELIDHGELLLQHLEPDELLGRHHRLGQPGHGHGHLEHLRERRAQRPDARAPSTSSRSRRPTASAPPMARCSTSRPRPGPQPPPRARPPLSRGTTATLNGTVNAEGASTTVTFCYSTSSTIGQLHGRPSPR